MEPYEQIQHDLLSWRGAAKAYVCRNCGKQAAHWTLKADTHELLHAAVLGVDKTYSTNVNDYEPKCKKHAVVSAEPRNG